VKKVPKRLGYTPPTPRLDPDFDSWVEAWTPRSVSERQRLQPDA
jgi:hypothetical protein